MKGLGYFGVGAAAGALGAGVGVGIQIASAGASFWAGFVGSSQGISTILSVGYTSSFMTGAAVGTGAGFSAGFTTGFGNGLMGGQNFGQALWSGTKDGLIGGASGALLGGLAGGIDAAADGRNFWHGGRKTTDVSMLLPPTNQIGELDCRYETFRSVDTYYNSESSSVSDLRIDYLNAEKSTYQLQRMYNSKGMSLQDIGVTPDMTKSEIAQRMASSMQNNNAIHYEFRIGSGGHAVGVNRVRVWDNGKIQANFMNPSGAGGYSARYFRQLLNVFSVLKF